MAVLHRFYCIMKNYTYSKICVKQQLSKRPKIGFQTQLSLNAVRKYCRMLPLEHSAILLTFIKRPFIIKIFVCLFLSGRFKQVLLYNEKLHIRISHVQTAKTLIGLCTCFVLLLFNKMECCGRVVQFVHC